MDSKSKNNLTQRGGVSSPDRKRGHEANQTRERSGAASVSFLRTFLNRLRQSGWRGAPSRWVPAHFPARPAALRDTPSFSTLPFCLEERMDVWYKFIQIQRILKFKRLIRFFQLAFCAAV